MAEVLIAVTIGIVVVLVSHRVMIHRERMFAIEHDRKWAFPLTMSEQATKAIKEAEENDPDRELKDDLLEAYQEVHRPDEDGS